MRAPDVVLGSLARISACVVLLMLASLLTVLVRAAAPSISTFGGAFITGTVWRPNEIERPQRDANGTVVIEDGEVVTETVPPVFGAAPVLYGTAASSGLALLLALPFGVGTALLLVRFGTRFRITHAVSFLVELLAAVPSIAYGMWGLFVLAPFLQGTVEPFLARVVGAPPDVALTGRDLLCGSLILAVMVVPIITALARDVLRAVPVSLVEGSVALGATWWQTSWTMVRESRSGLFGAALLGLARAAGETMAVTMVIGNANRITPSLFAPAQTMSSLLANEFAEAGGSLHRAALLEVALLLLASSLALNVVARWLVVGGRGGRDR